MTPDQFETRYRLTIRADSRDVETWQAIRVDSNDEVMVHRLVGPRRAAIEHMLAYLDDGGNSRVVDQFTVGDTPVIVTTPLAPSSTFIDWLQDHVPPTVTALLRPIEIPATPGDFPTTPSIASPQEPASTPAPHTSARADGVESADPFEAFRIPDRSPNVPSARVPTSRAPRESGTFRGPTADEDQREWGGERIARSPRVRTNFDLRPDIDETSAEFAPVDDHPVDDVESEYSQIVRPRPVLEPSAGSAPGARETAAPRRRSIVPIAIVSGVLVIAFVVTLVWAVLQSPR
jgi:hypothetical protein